MELKVTDFLASAFIRVYILFGLLIGIAINEFFPESANGLEIIAFGVLFGQGVYYGVRFWWEELR